MLQDNWSMYCISKVSKILVALFVSVLINSKNTKLLLCQLERFCVAFRHLMEKDG